MGSLKSLLAFLGRSDGSLHQRAIRSSVWVGLWSAGVAVLTFARGLVLARLLAPDVFGLMAVALMATRLVDIFTDTGFGAALIHRQDHFERAKDTAFTMLLLRGVALFGFSILLAPWLAAFYEQPVLESIVIVSGASFLFVGCQNINTVALQKDLNLKTLSYLELTKSTIGFGIAVGLAWWLRNVWALVYAQVATAAIGSLLSFTMVPGRPRLRFDRTTATELYAYGRFITGLAIVVFCTRELDNAVIGKLLGMEMLGYYVVAYSLANMPSDYLSRFMSKVIFPMFSTLQRDTVALQAEYMRVSRLVTVVVVPLSIATAVLAPEIVNALYGDRWSAAARPLQVLAMFGCFRALWLLNGYAFNAMGKPRLDFYMNLGRLLVMGVLLFPLTRAYGLVGASVAVTAPMALQFVVGMRLARRYIGVPMGTTLRPFALAVAQGVVLAAILSAAKAVVRFDPWAGVICLIALAATVSVAFNIRDVRMLFAHGAR